MKKYHVIANDKVNAKTIPANCAPGAASIYLDLFGTDATTHIYVWPRWQYDKERKFGVGRALISAGVVLPA